MKPEINVGQTCIERSGNCFGDERVVKVVKLFKDGSCHVEDDETIQRRTFKWRASHTNKLTPIQ